MKKVNGARMIGAAALSLALAAPLSAQDLGVTLVGETAGDDVNLFLAEGTMAGGGIGISPVASLQTYLVTYDVEGAPNTWSVNPKVGLRFGMDGGFLQGLVGYAFKGAEDDMTTPFFGGAEDGVTASAHAEYWGTGVLGLQGIAAHNFGSDYLWTRGRGTVAVMGSRSGSLHVGAEAGWQGDVGDDEDGILGIDVDRDYSAVMFGPILKWVTPNVTGVVGAGWKNIDEDFAPEGEDSTWYGRVELFFSPNW